MQATRRSFIAAAAALPLVRTAAAAADLRSDARGIVKLQADLDIRKTTFWFYEVTLYAVSGDGEPRLILRGEGCETYSMQREADGGYRATASTLSLFKDPMDDRWLDRWHNPLTDQEITVRPNVLKGNQFAFPRDGSVPLPIVPAGKSGATGWLHWIESGDRIGCTMERRGTGSYQPLMETTSLWTDRIGFLDPAKTRAEAVFASSYLSPWLGWMTMGDRPGHLLWHSSGRKLRGPDELPSGYQARARTVASGFLTAGG